MEYQFWDTQKPEDSADSEAVNGKIKARFMDLYDYFRMDSSMDPIILFEQLCCLLILLQDRTTAFFVQENDPTVRYRKLMERFHLSVLNDHLTVDPATFLDRPELIRRLLDTTDGILELTQNKKLLLPLLFDFLETIVQARRSETVGTPLQTAREIVKLICESSQPVFAIRTLDPSCGSGAFPLALLEQAAEKNTLFVDKIEGLERDEHLRNCVMLMARFYDPFESRVTVADGGSPIQIAERSYDFILANPPFRTQSLRDREIVGDYLELPVPTKDTHRAFLQRTLLGLRPGGTSAIIVPDSFLTHTGSDAIRVRRWIIEEFQCVGIVKLPAYTFYPQASVNASILFLHRPQLHERSRSEHGGIFFFAVEVDGRTNDTRRLPVNRNDFDELRQVWDTQTSLWHEWREEARTQNVHGMDVPVQWNHPNFWFGSLEDIRRSDYSLLPEQYQPVRLLGRPVRDPEEILEEIQKLGQEIMELTQQLAEASYDR